MNFKQLFPTFRNRYRFVRSRLNQLSAQREFNLGLNLGTGEGDYDSMLAGYVKTLIGCDVNEEDLVHARALNKGVMNLTYEVNNALALSYPASHFDLIVSSEVIEHVGDPATMLKEMSRVLTPGGYAVMTFPSREFPFTYDPINRIWQWLRSPQSKENLISQGGYAFGHDYLIGAADFKAQAKAAGLEIVEFKPLSGALVGLLEMYWTGIAQSIFKKNSRNVNDDSAGALKIRPADTSEPKLALLTDLILWLDSAWFFISSRSVGKGVVLKKS